MGLAQKKLIEEGSMQGRPFRRYDDGSYKAASSGGWLKFDSIDSLVQYHRERAARKKEEKTKSGLLQKLIDTLK
ncbi:MAG: hypothetical protein COC00_010785 [Rhizobiales bacterium]|nr:hypothetical protein [Hyphomicrobiales bacterium]